MELIKKKLTDSIEDNYFSREEGQELKELLATAYLNGDERMELARFVIAEASRKMDGQNHSYLMKWLKKVIQLLSDNTSSPVRNTAFFSHQDNIRKKVIDTILLAKDSLDICVFTISENNMANAILEIHKRNVPVRVITDDEKIHDKGSDIFKFRARGIKVKIDSTDSLMHHKFAIVDQKTVVNGSFNWTRTASEVNNENVVIMDNPAIVTSFCEEFERLWSQMRDL
jgi:mitochondrial cardiolipin hydrolase